MSPSFRAPVTVIGENVCPPSVDSYMPLQFEPARQPTTASTTFVLGLTATSETNAWPETPPACELAFASPVPTQRPWLGSTASAPTDSVGASSVRAVQVPPESFQTPPSAAPA